jgi:integrase
VTEKLYVNRRESAVALTDTQIRNAKPKEKAYVLNDGRGLNLEISPKGGKWWRLRYTFAGKANRISLGTYPDVSLVQARERREQTRKLIAQGIDPTIHRKEAKAAQQAKAETFELVAREWYAKQLPTWTESHAVKVIGFLERNAFPWLGNRPIREIMPTETLEAARRVEARGAIESAHRTVGYVSMVFRYAVACGMADSDPTRDIRGALSPTNEKHFASITDPKGVGELLRAIDGYTGEFVTRCAMRLAPLVFLRPCELRKAEWAELDVDALEWRIPGPRMKMRSLHIVPLSRQTLAIFEELRPYTGSGRYVFPSARTSERPMSANTVNGALRRLGYSKEEMTGHGFRSTASTLLNEQGWNRDAVERQLAHSDRNKVRAAYNYAEFLPERRKMMQAWADYLDALREGGKVLPLFKEISGE